MGLIFFIYLSIGVIFLLKDTPIPFIMKCKYRLPMSIKEKETLKYYHGIEDLSKNIENYKEEVFKNLILFSPLIVIGLIADVGLVFLAFAILFVAYRYRYLQIKNIVEKRRIEFFKEYPGFLNSLKLYLQSGLTLENALGTYFTGGGKGYYLTLIKSGLDKIGIGINRKTAFLEIILSTRERELIKLVNFFIQFYQVGVEGNDYLIQLGDEAWKLKKETVKRLAEEGSAKMVIPMMLIFIGISLLVLIPSVFSIINGNLF